MQLCLESACVALSLHMEHTQKNLEYHLKIERKIRYFLSPLFDTQMVLDVMLTKPSNLARTEIIVEQEQNYGSAPNLF